MSARGPISPASKPPMRTQGARLGSCAAIQPCPYSLSRTNHHLPGSSGDYLIGAGYDVTQTHNGPDGLRAARELDPDLVVLISACPDSTVSRSAARSAPSPTATSSCSQPAATRSISSGARRRCRRLPHQTLLAARAPRPDAGRIAPPLVSKLATDSRATAWHFQGLTIDTATREVVLHEAPVSLTRTEFDILATIAACPRRVYSRRHIIDAVWGAGWGGDEHIVDVHVAHLRRKLGDDPLLSRYVDTVRGVGYRFVAEPVRGPGR